MPVRFPGGEEKNSLIFLLEKNLAHFIFMSFQENQVGVLIKCFPTADLNPFFRYFPQIKDSQKGDRFVSLQSPFFYASDEAGKGIHVITMVIDQIASSLSFDLPDHLFFERKKSH